MWYFQDQLLSFEKNYLFYGQLTKENTVSLLHGDDEAVYVTIWFKNGGTLIHQCVDLARLWKKG